MMVMLHDCIACQHGDHDEHEEIIEVVPEGVIGGAMCPCKGECRDRPREIAIRYAELPDLSEFTEFMERFEDQPSGQEERT